MGLFLLRRPQVSFFCAITSTPNKGSYFSYYQIPKPASQFGSQSTCNPDSKSVSYSVPKSVPKSVPRQSLSGIASITQLDDCDFKLCFIPFHCNHLPHRITLSFEKSSSPF